MLTLKAKIVTYIDLHSKQSDLMEIEASTRLLGPIPVDWNGWLGCPMSLFAVIKDSIGWSPEERLQ